MLLSRYDPERIAVINPDMIYDPIEDFPPVTVSCFSYKLFDAILACFPARKIGELHCAYDTNPVYELIYKGRRFSFVKSYVGEPACAGQYEDLIRFGSKVMILVGNCGVLDKEIEDCGIIIPTAAIRDEGLSYHYMPPSDTIAVNKHFRDEFKEVLSEHGYPYVEGRTWTTDAFYRETRDKVKQRKEQGAICVEMECAGMQAVADFRNRDFFQFFYAGDNLDQASWDERSLSGGSRLDDKAKIMLLAFELGLKIMEKEKL